MESVAKVHHARISSRKVDQILMLIRGKSVASAVSILRLVTKGARPIVEKTLLSAFANAGKTQNPEAWHVTSAWVGNGPQIKRMRAHAMGRGATIRHRTSHLTIILSDQKKSKKGSEA